MASIQKAATLVKRIVLANLSADEGLFITPMLNGPHGIGKSQILKQVAKDLGGYCFIVEGGALKEGEITGLPVASLAADGSTEVRFVKHYAVNKMAALERYYYEKAQKEGFLDGKVKLEIDEQGNKWLIDNSGKSPERKMVGTTESSVVAGEDNKYKFGAELSPETKMRLIDSGEIKLALFFVDELNRTEMTTMKELMNIILNKSINGYDLPWWVAVVSAVNPCSQNSTYATNELDDAQLDRFLKIRVDANPEEWVDYALAKGLNSDVIEGVVISENIFIHREKGQEDTSEMSPSPRSWEMVCHLYETIHDINNTKYFDADERKTVDDDLRILIRGKVGETAGRTVLENINRKENNIKPIEILSGKDRTLDKAVVEKFNRQKTLTQKIIADNVVNYLVNNFAEIEKGKTSTDEKKKAYYANVMAQLKEFANLLPTATQITFVKKVIASKDGKTLFGKLAKAFSTDILANIYEAKAALKDLNKE